MVARRKAQVARRLDLSAQRLMRSAPAGSSAVRRGIVLADGHLDAAPMELGFS